jgi:hypothetical protein
MYPQLVRAQGRARWRLLLKPRPGSGEDAIPPEAEVEAESGGRARRRPPPEAEAWGRARRSFLSRPRPNSVVDCDLLSASPGWLAWQSERGGRRCFPVISDRKERGEVTAVTSAWPTEARVSGYGVGRPLHWMRLRSGRLVRRSGQGCFTTKPARAGLRESWWGARCLRRPSGEAWTRLGLLLQPEAGLGWGRVPWVDKALTWTAPVSWSEGVYRPWLGVLGVPLIMVPDTK